MREQSFGTIQRFFQNTIHGYSEAIYSLPPGLKFVITLLCFLSSISLVPQTIFVTNQGIEMAKKGEVLQKVVLMPEPQRRQLMVLSLDEMRAWKKSANAFTALIWLNYATLILALALVLLMVFKSRKDQTGRRQNVPATLVTSDKSSDLKIVYLDIAQHKDNLKGAFASAMRLDPDKLILIGEDAHLAQSAKMRGIEVEVLPAGSSIPPL